jgi:hypothetical protein
MKTALIKEDLRKAAPLQIINHPLKRKPTKSKTPE